MTKTLKTPGVVELLRAHYPKNAFAFLEQVRNGTGWKRQERYADAIAMSLWPSRGLEVIGHEVKVSRSDWVRELANPAKADAIAQYCDRWYLVAADESLVREGELPPAWGLMVVNDGRIRVVRAAPKLDGTRDMDRNFVAAVIRRAAEQVSAHAEAEKSRQEAYRQGYDSGKRSMEYQVKVAEDRLQEYRRNVEAFEAASGVEVLRGWPGPEKIGEAVRMVLDGTDQQVVHRLEVLRSAVLPILEMIDRALAARTGT